jgi:transcriptional regulator with XRE-family HTH domain
MRIEAGLSQAQLAKLAGTTQATISRLETGG